MISKTHISAQQPCERQLNAKVCGCKCAIFRLLSSSNNDNLKIVQVLTVITKLMLITARSYTTTQYLQSSKFTLVNKAVHSTAWLLSVA